MQHAAHAVFEATLIQTTHVVLPDYFYDFD
jgi:hypothetical protein